MMTGSGILPSEPHSACTCDDHHQQPDNVKVKYPGSMAIFKKLQNFPQTPQTKTSECENILILPQIH